MYLKLIWDNIAENLSIESTFKILDSNYKFYMETDIFYKLKTF